MSGRVQWKKFAFFDKDTVNENISGTLGAQLTCACADNGLLLFGDTNGFISLSDRNLHLSWKHKIFRGPVKGVAYVESQRRQYVIAAGDEYIAPATSAGALGNVSVDIGRASEVSDSNNAVTASSPSRFAVKIFAVSDMTRPLQAFLVTQNCVKGHVLTAFSVNSDCTQIAVGFSNGALMLYGGHFLRDHSLVGRLPPAPTVLFPYHHAPIAALHFCELFMLPASKPGGPSLRQLRLFAVLDTETITTGRGSMFSSIDRSSMGSEVMQAGHQAVSMGGIFVFDTSIAEDTGSLSAMPQTITLPRLGVPRMLDERGASTECSSLMMETAELVIGREEGVFLYSVDDRGGAAGFEGEKQCVTAVGRYILVGSMDVKTRRVLVTIYDLRNKFISMSHLLAPGDNIKMVLHDGGVAYVVTTSGTLIRFREKDTLSKVDVLLKKSLHALAILLAAEEQAPVAEVMKLYKMYGDHLFRRGDFEAAVIQYSHTIGFVPASYVIRRFLDSQRIGHLTSYLETLHKKGFASKDLTTLLLTCYTKTRDVDRLDAFISQGDTFNNQDDESPSKETDGNHFETTNRFDISAAISTLRHAGYTAHAMRLALRYGDHDGYLSMLLNPIDNESVDNTTAVPSEESAEAIKASEALADPGEAAFGHLIGIVDDVVASLKSDLDNGYKYNTTASSVAAGYTTRKMTNGTSMRITESTVDKLDSLLAILKRHGRRILALKPDAMTGLLIMLYTGVPLGIVNESRVSTAGEGDKMTKVITSAIDLRALLAALAPLSVQSADGTSTETKPEVINTIQVSSYSDALYSIEDLVSLFVDDFGADDFSQTDNSGGRWHKRYLMTFLEGSVVALTGYLSGSTNLNVTNKVVINMKGGRKVKLNSQMTGLLIELCLELYDKLKHASIASSTAIVNGIALQSEDQRRIAMSQLEVKVMNMLDGTVAADYDAGHAMLLVHSFNFTPGMLYLLEKSQSVDVILGQLREHKDYNGIFRIMRREGAQYPDLMLQQLEFFVLESVELQQERQLKLHNKSVKKSTPVSTVQKHQDSDDEYQSSHGKSSDDGSDIESSDESDSDSGIYHNVETMLDIIEPEVMYAGSELAGEANHGHISISQVLKILALNPNLPLSIPLNLIKSSLKGVASGLPNLEKETYKMRLTVACLLNKPVKPPAQKKVSIVKPRGRNNQFGGDDSDEDMKVVGMLGYNELDDVGDDDYEHIVQQAELVREKQHWDGIKKAQMEKVNDHESFYAELDASTNGFQTVASFFCKKPIPS